MHSQSEQSDYVQKFSDPAMSRIVILLSIICVTSVWSKAVNRPHHLTTSTAKSTTTTTTTTATTTTTETDYDDQDEEGSGYDYDYDSDEDEDDEEHPHRRPGRRPGPMMMRSSKKKHH